MGISRWNIHIIEKTLDSNKQVTPTSKIEKIVGVIKNGIAINCTISNNIATIVDESLDEGDTVDIILSCIRTSEGGAICEQKVVQADEDKWQAYLDAQ